jgi:hypothetical protein
VGGVKLNTFWRENFTTHDILIPTEAKINPPWALLTEMIVLFFDAFISHIGTSRNGMPLNNRVGVFSSGYISSRLQQVSV